MSWNRSTEPVKPVKKEVPPSMLKGILGGLAAVAVCVAAFFIFSSDSSDGRARTPAAPQKIKEVTSAKMSAKRVHEKPKTVAEVVENVEEIPRPLFKVRPIPPEEWQRLTNRIFKTGTEQLMCWVFTVEPGAMPTPIPRLDDEEVKEIVSILVSKNEVQPTDDEIVAYCKEQVAAAKKEMLAYLKDGGDPNDFLQHYQQQLMTMFNMRNDAVDQIREFAEENPDLADELLEKVNEKLAEDGIKTIKEEEL